MSLILDALSRSEREKRAEDTPVPDILTEPAPAAGPTRPAWLWTAIVASGVILSLVLVLVLMRGGGDADVQESAPAESGASADPGAGTAVTPITVAAGSEQQVAALQPPGPSLNAVQQMDKKTPVSTSSPSPANTRAASPSRQTAAVPIAQGRRESRADREIAALYETADSRVAAAASADTGGTPAAVESAEERDATPATKEFSQLEATADAAEESVATTVEETPIDVETLLLEVQRVAESESLSPHPVPLLDSLSQQFRDTVPTLMYRQHDFTVTGGSTVRLNGQDLRTGQRTRGVEVVDILPDSVILRFSGTEFRLRALNSWVNL